MVGRNITWLCITHTLKMPTVHSVRNRSFITRKWICSYDHEVHSLLLYDQCQKNPSKMIAKFLSISLVYRSCLVPYNYIYLLIDWLIRCHQVSVNPIDQIDQFSPWWTWFFRSSNGTFMVTITKSIHFVVGHLLFIPPFPSLESSPELDLHIMYLK